MKNFAANSLTRKQDGFTFLEIMIVVLVMGIMLVLSVLAFPKQNSEDFIQKQAESIQNEISDFKFRMQLEGKVGLIKVENNTLSFFSITKGKILLLSSFHAEDALELEFNQKKDAQLYQQKMIVFLPSSEQTPFELKILAKDRPKDTEAFSMSISASTQGEIQLQASKT